MAWMRIFYVCLFLACLHAAAEELPGATVWTSGSVESARALFAPGSNVRILGREEEKRRDQKTGHLPPLERDAVFRKLGLESKVSGMDEFDKDLLIMSAREYTVRELKSDYPMFSEAQLSKLKREVGKPK